MRPTTRYVWDWYQMAPIALVLIAAIVLGVVVATRPNSSPKPGRSASPSSSIDRTAPDWFAALPFNCLGSAGIGLAPTSSVALVEGVGASTQTGYDRVVIQFAGAGPPQAQLRTQLGATFTQNPSGKLVTLKGKNGALVTVPLADGHTRYSGPDDLKTGYPLVLEMRKVQDYEGTVQWAIGLAQVPCYRMAFLDSPVRLAIDFRWALA
jgi:hypothetical protein